MTTSSTPVARPTGRPGPGAVRDLPLAGIVLVVVASRLLILADWGWAQGFGLGDVPYYFSRAGMLAVGGVGETLREYPTPLAGLLYLPWLLGRGDEQAYVVWFVTLVLVADLAFCWLLWRSRLPGRGWAIVVWSLAGTLLGPLIWLRVDVFPGVLVGAAALFAATRPGVAGALLAAGAAVKLWPGVLAGFLVNRADLRNHRWWRPALGFAVTGGVVVVASLLADGWDRLISPVQWQGDRGLQIESVPATVLMALRATDTSTWSVLMSQYQAFELFGPGVAATLVVTEALTALGALAGVLLLIRNFRRTVTGRADRTEAIAVGMLAAISLLIVTNKTLSPQYVIWLAGPLAAVVAMRGLRVRRVGWWVTLVGLIAALTHLVYPVWYGYVNGMADDPVGTPLATAALVVRNLLLVVFTASTVHAALVGSRSGRTDR